MNYCLENKNEANRLEKQSSSNQYDCSKELESISFLPSDHVLDAGCGSGLVSRYISDAFNVRSIYGYDSSYQRIYAAKDLAAEYKNIEFYHSDLCDIKSIESRFDKAISRFVFQHLDDPIKAATEIKRVLKPSGQIVIIDTDGLAFDLYTQNTQLNQLMDLVKKKFTVDMYIGRKLPQILLIAGFVDIDWNIQPMVFKGDDLQSEYETMKLRFKGSKKHFIEILGSKEKCEAFFDLYLEEMMKPENVLFYSKFIVTASKPGISMHLAI